MTASVPAVVDVSVLVAGLISRRGGRLAATVSLIDLWWAGAIEPVVCPTLIGEFEANPRKNKIAWIIPPPGDVDVIPLNAKGDRLRAALLADDASSVTVELRTR